MSNTFIRVGVFTLGQAAMVFGVAGVSASAAADDPTQSQTADERIEQQEQRIQELEERLRVMEAALRSGRFPEAQPPTPAPSSDLAPGNGDSPPAAADATESEQLVPERLDLSSGEFRETQHIVTGASLASDEFPGSWPMFGTDYRLKFGGYFKIDALYDFDGAGDDKQFLMSQIPIEGTPEAGREGYFNILVNETRFNFDIRKTTAGEPAQRYVLEMDFFDERNNAPRLRHAYLQYGNLIVGQTWSITTELRAINYMIEWAYGDAIYGTRSKQIRWQKQIDNNWSWAVGVEKLDFPGIDSQGLPGAANSKLPLLAGRVSYESAGMLVTVGAAVNELRWDGQDIGPDATATAWNSIVSGRKNFGDQSYATFSLAIGDGAAEGMGAFAGQNYNATLFPDGTLQTNSYWDLSLGYTHKFGDVLSTNLNLAQFDLDSDYARRPDSMDNGWIAHANLIWKLRPQLLTGVEYIWGHVQNVNGAKGDAARLQAMIRYNY